MKNGRINLRLLLSILLLLAGLSVHAQCKIENNYFRAGEVLEYDLYIRLGILSTKGGTATLRTTATTYAGQEAYKMTLTSSSKGAARALFELDDTLSCYMTKELVPLAYLKDAHEGGDYTKERQTYFYSETGQVSARSVRHKDGVLKFDEFLNFNTCTYDLMSVVFFARTLDFEAMKKGRSVNINFMSGRDMRNARLIYDGTDRVKANNNVKYDCIKLLLKVADKAFEDGKDAMKVYITNDANRMIIRMDSDLKVGSTRVMLKSYRGLLHPVGSRS
jgi:hypothetical protein